MDKILLAQVVVRNYHLNKGKPRCTLNIDIMKAFDSVKWDFLRKVMQAFGFLGVFIHWIMQCTSTPKFSTRINGWLKDFLQLERDSGKVTLSSYICLPVFM